MNKFIQTGVFLLTLLLVINVTIINLFVLRSSRTATEQTVIAVENEPDISVCDDTCQKNIANELLREIPTPTETKKYEKNLSVKQKETILSLGSGSTNATEWKEIPGVEITIDREHYEPISSVIFETYLSVPTSNGIVFAKLFNATDKRDVWFSDVSSETNLTFKKEATIQIESGKKTYKVMMKTTMGYEAILHNARIRIVSG